jgi:hypothetical protein
MSNDNNADDFLNPNGYKINTGNGEGYASQGEYDWNMQRIEAKSRAASTAAPANTVATKTAAVTGLAPTPPSQASRPANATADVLNDSDIESKPHLMRCWSRCAILALT